MRDETDTLFFTSVLREEVLREAMRETGIESWNPAIGSQPFNKVLKIWRPEWLLRLPQGDTEGVNVHFEARRRNELRIESELHPYIPSLKKNRQLESSLTSQLELKAQ